jgi:hypothetical protein
MFIIHSDDISEKIAQLNRLVINIKSHLFISGENNNLSINKEERKRYQLEI